MCLKIYVFLIEAKIYVFNGISRILDVFSPNFLLFHFSKNLGTFKHRVQLQLVRVAKKGEIPKNTIIERKCFATIKIKQIIFSLKKRMNSDTCYDMDKP